MEAKKCLVKPAVQEYERYETYSGEWKEKAKDIAEAVIVGACVELIVSVLQSCT